jgi:(1->4)-alpha-D-glucan 1-alpha-D-glucosylmutase
LLEDIQETIVPVLATGFVNSLTQLALKLTVPGVPDIYQGTELSDLSLVDPDNRRPVDFVLRHQLLDCLAHPLGSAVAERYAETGRQENWKNKHPEHRLGLAEEFSIAHPGELNQRVIGPTAALSHRGGAFQ